MTIAKSLQVKFNQALRDRNLLPAHAKILIAVSGGQDSLCLWHLISQAQAQRQWQIAIAHCDHRWRADSADCAAHVRSLAERAQVPYFARVADQQLCSEAAAREWRYRMLTEIAQTHHFNLITTGHTRSDRAETLLYNLMRGSGSDGLQALGWQRTLAPDLTLVRPLLAISRSETAALCAAAHLEIWSDSTNQQLQYRRNRIRHQLIPYMATHFNPQVEIALSQTAELLDEDVLYLEQQAQALWQPDHFPRLNRQTLQAQPIALQRRAIRQFLRHYLPQVSMGYGQVERLSRLLTAPNRSRSSPLTSDAWAEVNHPWIELKLAGASQ
ncbi:MAG: tRNA lysidine(34) synthetase TilS [Pseudanabaenaceae cyanobacterium bins.68]|nr:tRNA lysidine(34) synthetase TilS [Pseudanabaenaceae cyanobacterium bins.68]